MDAARVGTGPLIVAPAFTILPTYKLSSVARLNSRGRLSLHVCLQLLDFSVGKGLQFFYDLLQPAAALGVILLGWQGASLLGILLVESLDVTDLGLQ
jgi:hypothetical protein